MLFNTCTTVGKAAAQTNSKTFRTSASKLALATDCCGPRGRWFTPASELLYSQVLAVPGGSLGMQHRGAQTPLPPKIPQRQVHKALTGRTSPSTSEGGELRDHAGARCVKWSARDRQPSRWAPVGASLEGNENQAF